MTSSKPTTWRKSSYSDANGECVEVASWRKSSHSSGNGACVEVASWRKSSHSAANANCVEVGIGERIICVRDTRQYGIGAVLEFSPTAWISFIVTL